jgi:hypothetical protein
VMVLLHLVLSTNRHFCSEFVGVRVLPPSGTYCLEILGDSTSWNLKGLSRPVMG